MYWWELLLENSIIQTRNFPLAKNKASLGKNVMRAAFSGSWVNFHSGKSPQTQNSSKLLPRRGSWAPEDSVLQLVFSPSGKSWAVTCFTGQLCQFAPKETCACLLQSHPVPGSKGFHFTPSRWIPQPPDWAVPHLRNSLPCAKFLLVFGISLSYSLLQ